MAQQRFSKSTFGRFLLILLTIIIVASLGYYLWQKKKIGIVENKIRKAVINKTDSLYSISFDSLYFDERTGEAYLRNVKVIPDTSRARALPVADQPGLVAAISVSRLTIKGIKTSAALFGTQLAGDSVMITDPDVKLYFLKNVDKETDINKEAGGLYKQILGKLTLIQVGKVIITNASVTGYDFNNGYKDFEIKGAGVSLFDVLVDSLHERDTSRTLFTKNAYFNVGQFNSFKEGRRVTSADNIVFLGKEKKIAVEKFTLAKSSMEETGEELIAEIKGFLCTGLNTDVFIREKQILADTVSVKSIFLLPPKSGAMSATAKNKKRTGIKDSSGFSKVYGIKVGYINFPDLKIKTSDSAGNDNKFNPGNISVIINKLDAKRLIDFTEKPLSQFEEIIVSNPGFSFENARSAYITSIKGLRYNSRNNNLYIGSFSFLSRLSESGFAKKAGVQLDRYDIRLNGINLSGIDPMALIEKKLFAQALTVNSGSVKIFRDLSYRLESVSKIGNYPHQMLLKIKVPLNIRRAELNNTLIEYKEKNPLSDSSGAVRLVDTRLIMKNITNLQPAIAKDKFFTASLNSKILGFLPLTMDATFDLTSQNGGFSIKGSAKETDAKKLNVVARPMALVELDEGRFNSIKFNFTGNDMLAKGDFEFLYEGLKIKLLKVDEESKNFKRKGVLSFIANKFVKDENPHKGETRRYRVQFDRNPYKSFFNLVWKTLFTGLQETLGLPGKRNAVKIQ